MFPPYRVIAPKKKKKIEHRQDLIAKHANSVNTSDAVQMSIPEMFLDSRN